MLNKVCEKGIGTKEGQNLLLSAKAGLLRHLKTEDEKLYLILHKTAATSPDLKRKLELFAKDMDQISKAALDFFQKYSRGGSGVEK